MKQTKIKINNKDLVVYQLNLEQTFKLIFLLLPYLPIIENKWPELMVILKSFRHRDELLTAFFRVCREELSQSPKDLVMAFAILINKNEDLEWVAKNVSALDLVVAMPKLDKLNNFRLLFNTIKVLGTKYDK